MTDISWEAQNWDRDTGIHDHTPDLYISGNGNYILINDVGYVSRVQIRHVPDGNVYNYISEFDGTNGWHVKEIAISETGQYMAAIGYKPVPYGGMNVLLSSDYGETWVEKEPDPEYAYGKLYLYTVAMSSTGQYIVVTKARNVYISSDYGENWASFALPSSYDNYALMSKDGSTVVLGQQYYIAVSTNYGVEGSFSYKSFPEPISWIDDPHSMCIAGDTNILYGAFINEEATVEIYKSEDLGDSWDRVRDLSAYEWVIQKIVCSASGLTVATALYLSGIEEPPSGFAISEDYGGNWNQGEMTAIYGYDVAMCYDSSKILYRPSEFDANIWLGTKAAEGGAYSIKISTALYGEAVGKVIGIEKDLIGSISSQEIS